MLRQLSFIAAVFLLGSGAGEDRPDGSIVVQVVDQGTGQPIHFAKVAMTATLETLEKQKLRGVEEQDQLLTLGPQEAGTFGARNIEPGEYILLVVAEGYGNELVPVEIPADSMAEVVMRLNKSGKIFGSVTDTAGRPIKAARVNVVYLDPSLVKIVDRMVNVPGYLAPTTETDQRGEFVIAKYLMPGKDFVLEAASEDFLPAFSDLLNCRENQTVAAGVVLSARGVTLRGLVTDSNGAPVAGAKIGLRGPSIDPAVVSPQAIRTFAHSTTRRLSQNSESLEDGTFSITNLFPGVVQVGVSAPGFVHNKHSVTLTMPETFLRVEMRKQIP